MKYLHNPESLQKDSEDTFFYLTSKADMYKMPKQIPSRLFGKYNNDSYENSETLSDSQIEELSLEKQLELEIADSLQEFSVKSLAAEENEFRTLTKEFQIFESTGKRTPNLQQLLDVLCTPTSTQNERNFSTATKSLWIGILKSTVLSTMDGINLYCTLRVTKAVDSYFRMPKEYSAILWTQNLFVVIGVFHIPCVPYEIFIRFTKWQERFLSP
ncbi:uncharacterized protein LOC143363059 [Halictus rubicundus]|uniref:uncharacterized protein LOC143363059 n=1 Tax=Halictus rubicundus TaxID=77578 RepID=UPI0040350A86